MKLTNKHNLPKPIYEAIQNDKYDVDATDLNIISCTTLLSPPKIRLLRSRHWDEISEDAADKFWILLGQATHDVLERMEGANRLQEERINLEIDGKTVSGKMDLYDDEVITDYKVTSVWTIVYNPQGKKEWVEQLNILAYLLRTSGFEVKRLQISAILRDWSQTKARTDENYPQIPYKTINMPLWSEEKQLEYIKKRVAFHSECENLSDDDIPTCTKEERWTTDDSYAVYKGKNKRATKVFTDKVLAETYAQDHDMRLELRPGIDRKCKDYCQVNQFCKYYKESTK